MSPDGAERLADVLELLTKAAGLLALIGAFLQWIAKPYVEWRRKRLSEAITQALEPAIQKALEPTKAMVMLSLERQNQIFDEFDLLMVVLADNSERLDE